MTHKTKVFAALLKYWRGLRGLSQLDLSLAADVSSRHISFLETGRSQPSEDMVLRLGAVLDVPLRERNDMLRAAGFEAFYQESELDAMQDTGVFRALELMLSKHDPLPMFVMNQYYDVVRMNQSAHRLFQFATGSPVGEDVNALEWILERESFREILIDWEHTAHEMISRLHRESLQHPEKKRLGEMLARFTAQPHIPAEWKHPDFSTGQRPTFTMRFRVQGVELGFLTTLTRFSVPQNITLEELQIESYFPLDAATEELCEALASAEFKAHPV